MKIDVTLKITPKMVKDASDNEKKVFVGHLGTHFDVMNKQFPLEYTQRKGIVFDVSKIRERDIDRNDIDFNLVEQDMFVGFYTNFIDQEGYGTENYFHHHPQLSNDLIHQLVEKKISIIGIDAAGLRRHQEHTITDQYCADHNVFVVENLCNLKSIVNKNSLILNTYPMNYEGMSGLPCRVIADCD